MRVNPNIQIPISKQYLILEIEKEGRVKELFGILILRFVICTALLAADWEIPW